MVNPPRRGAYQYVKDASGTGLPLSGVYMIWNAISRKVYIGSALSLTKRKSEHWTQLRAGRQQNRHLQSAWKKYGEDAFDFVVIERVGDPTILCAIEQKYIDELRAFDPRHGYNGRRTAESNLGHTFSAETRDKIRRANLGKKQSTELIEKRIAPLRGRKLSAEHYQTLEQRCWSTKRGKKRAGATVDRMASGLARFAPGMVRLIDERFSGGERVASIAKSLGCAKSSISLVLNRRGRFYATIPYRDAEQEAEIKRRLRPRRLITWSKWRCR
jgi:group I intron endonuclease